MRQIMLYNTPTIDGRKIAKSLGIVTANQVAGTGFFTDMVASFSDFFGGNSGAYRNAMEQLYKNVEGQFCRKALEMGADAVVNVRIDFENISAKNMSMFMISVQGTAVKLEGSVGDDSSQSMKGVVTLVEIEQELKLQQFKELVSNGSIVDKEIFEGLFGIDKADLIKPMIQYFMHCKQNENSEWGQNGMDNVVACLSSFSYDDLINVIYSEECIEDELITRLKLFNAKKILEIAKSGDLKLACKLMNTNKSSYSKDDLADMRALLDYFENLPIIRRPEVVKGIFSAPHTVFVCQCGEKCEEGKIYCDYCFKNEKGLTREDVRGLDKLKKDIDIISQLLN